MVFRRRCHPCCQEFNAFFSIYFVLAPGRGPTTPFIYIILLQNKDFGDSVVKRSAAPPYICFVTGDYSKSPALNSPWTGWRFQSLPWI